MKYQIITAKETKLVAQMESFILSHNKCHFLQSPEWRHVKDIWDWRGILVWDDKKIVGVMSVLIRRLPMGLSFMYATRGPVCDREDPAVMGELFNGAKALAKEKKALHLYIDPDERDDNENFRKLMKSFGFKEKSDDGFGNIQPQFVFRLDIENKTEEEIFSAFTQKTRYNVRLATRKGVQVKHYFGDGEIPESELKAFSDIMNTTGERDHFKVRNQEYFAKLLKAFGKNAALFMADIEGKPIAGTIVIFYGNKTWYLYGASSNEHRNLMPNYLLQWEMISHAIQRGCAIYDFRGVPGEVGEDDPLYGLYRFKKGFSGEHTKFTGLFTYAYKPMMSWMFLKAMDIWRKIR